MPHHSVSTVPLAAAFAMLYARQVATFVRPGLIRLLFLAPVLALLLVLPFAAPLYSTRGTAAFFFVWLGEFKLLLLAFGRGPLDPALCPVRFVFTATLPVKLLRQGPDAAAGADNKAALPLRSSSIKVAIMVALLQVFKGKDQMHPYAAFALYGVYMYCFLDFLLPCLAALGRALGMGLEPQFDKPYRSASLQDFWGRRWNLMASAVLRPAVYMPVRARLGAPTGVLATFLVSGLMHEVIAYYITFRLPTGQLTAFFLLHGASVCAEKWCARRWPNTARLPRVVATPLVVLFVVGTAFWLFFPPLFGDGMDDRFIAEFDALLASLVDAGGRLLRLAGLAR
ncbi:putative long-chain-alcohol O-fatty-acyltransferase 4 [Dichanthelium oligosanthes]|uniref:Putative long-chain-alcohol O-fatty-acyltransferase 4 n=1 Tax=Dichanthelium oligosanthes TaxID=888268 RepID=A0A1E5UIS7_9POAL|nr:putative long-chain-alcohol O-fatty-acyltransferase 4 [Dichanthelium oligosanthes]